jgi:hypothetical protein
LDAPQLVVIRSKPWPIVPEPLTKTEERQIEILEKSFRADEFTMMRAALKVEDRRARRFSGYASVWTSLAAAVTAVATSLGVSTHIHHAGTALLGLGVALGVSVSIVLAARFAIFVKRQRQSSMTGQALVFSARLRNVYIQELRRYRSNEDVSSYTIERLQ